MTYPDLNRWSAELMGWIERELDANEKWYYDPSASRDCRWVMKVDNWTPLTDTNQLKMVIEKMQELGWYLTLEYLTTGLIEAGFIYKKTLPNRPQRVIDYNSDLNLAVLMAAHGALSK